MKPMLASAIEHVDTLRYPLLASPKLDGIRCLIMKDGAYSRNLKLIPNTFIQKRLIDAPEGLDGELVVGDAKAADCFNRSSSGVMSYNGEPDFTFWVFDRFDMPEHSFSARLDRAKLDAKNLDYASKPRKGGPFVKHVAHKLIAGPEELLKYESQMLIAGFEGIMLRDPAGPYKHGRSTLREGYLLKLKRFLDSEAEIIDVYEQERNDNEATLDELGRTKRTSHKAGKTGKGVLGGVVVRDIRSGVEFQIGTGFDDASRKELWAGRESLVDLVIKYKYQPTGVKEKPRFPVFLGFRDKIDL